jgi:hypothetical protein
VFWEIGGNDTTNDIYWAVGEIALRRQQAGEGYLLPGRDGNRHRFAFRSMGSYGGFVGCIRYNTACILLEAGCPELCHCLAMLMLLLFCFVGCACLSRSVCRRCQCSAVVPRDIGPIFYIFWW